MQVDFGTVVNGFRETKNIATALSLLSRILGIEADETDEKYIWNLTPRYGEKANLYLSKSDLLSCLAESNSMTEKGDLSVATGKTFEAAIRYPGSSNPLHFELRKKRRLLISEHSGSWRFYLGQPSSMFLMYYACEAFGMENMGRFPLSLMLRRALSLLPRNEFSEKDGEIEVFDVLHFIFQRPYSLRIEATTPVSFQAFEERATALLFNVAINTKISLVRQRAVETAFARRTFVARAKASVIEELIEPRRLYKPDLVSHYQRAITATEPSSQFLSLYHILENFFEDVFMDHLLNNVERKITDPEFSHLRRSDLRQLVEEISKSVQIRDSEMVFSESEALKLTLAKYLDLDRLVLDLDNESKKYLDDVASRVVEFANAGVVNLRSGDREEILKALAKRIYKIRNSIVHSKDSDKRRRFVPFKDDEALLQEIPLMLRIGEQVIVGASKPVV